MQYRCLHPRWLILFFWMVPLAALSEQKTWAGRGGDGRWSNPLNWVDARVPDSTDAVLLDNSGFPGSYQVTLPDGPVTVLTLAISPAAGSRIELILPASNKEINAFRTRGPGYGILLDAGAVFRNASGLSGGESLEISDSIRINDGGRYIHQTLAAHANGIGKRLSSSPGTEKGIFEFDVPRASYTLSVSNRTYGTLILSATAHGLPVNYTCSGSSPLTLGGDLHIGPNVSLSVNMSGAGGYIQLNGDYIQEGGTVTLASGGGDTWLRLRGNFVQLANTLLTAGPAPESGVELNGNRPQLVDAKGGLTGSLGFRLNNPSGCELISPLLLPHRLDLLQGRILSSAAALLTLGPACSIRVDSLQPGTYVDGPVKKQGLAEEPYFIFPVGANGYLRWMELKRATGSFTVAYRPEDARSLGSALGPGIDHISKKEYWRVEAEGDGPETPRADLELSFISPLSGGVTDPEFLNVSGYNGSAWLDAGHAAASGGLGYGSVTSQTILDFSGLAFTLASTVDLENPLPLTRIRFSGRETGSLTVFNWSVESPVPADHFDLLDLTDNANRLLARIKAEGNRIQYSWSAGRPQTGAVHLYGLNMVDGRGHLYRGNSVRIDYSGMAALRLFFVPAGPASEKSGIHARSADAVWLDYRILGLSGSPMQRGRWFIPGGGQDAVLPLGWMPRGIYQFCAQDREGKYYLLRFGL